MKYFLPLFLLIFLTACNTAQPEFIVEPEVQEPTSVDELDTDELDTTDETDVSEVHFSPEDEGWLAFDNGRIYFNFPEGFSVTEFNDEVYLTNSEAGAPLAMGPGEIWITFSPSFEGDVNIPSPSDGPSEVSLVSNASGSWYKLVLLVGGDGKITEEAKEIFEKVESSLYIK